MTKKITLSILLILFSISLAFCGKKEEPKEEMKEEVSTESSATGSDLGAKIKSYEDFVTKFCALSEKMKGASITEKATLASDFSKDSANLKTLQADLDAAKASDDEKKRIADASKKAAGCAAVAAGGSAPSMPATPSVPSIPTKAPSIPGM